MSRRCVAVATLAVSALLMAAGCTDDAAQPVQDSAPRVTSAELDAAVDSHAELLSRVVTDPAIEPWAPDAPATVPVQVAEVTGGRLEAVAADSAEDPGWRWVVHDRAEDCHTTVGVTGEGQPEYETTCSGKDVTDAFDAALDEQLGVPAELEQVTRKLHEQLELRYANRTPTLAKVARRGFLDRAGDELGVELTYRALSATTVEVAAGRDGFCLAGTVDLLLDRDRTPTFDMAWAPIVAGASAGGSCVSG